MLKNIERFKGWMLVDSYDEIKIGIGVITIEVSSLKTMMWYMPIVEELDVIVNNINSYNKEVLLNSSSGRFNKPDEYEDRLEGLKGMVDTLCKKIEAYDLEILSHKINLYSDNYFEELILKG